MKESKPVEFKFVTDKRQEPDKLSPEERIRHSASVYLSYSLDQAQNQAGRCLDCGNPYCAWQCPVHNHIPGWLRLVAEGKLEEAANLAHQTNPFPEVCGRICPQERLCEGACTLNDGLGAVTIGAIEQFIADKALENGWRPDMSAVKPNGRRVAVIGAGPAGLACASVLAKNGTEVSVFDKYPEIGGLLTFGIPEFKLEKKIIRQRRQILEEMGVRFHLNTEVGRDLNPQQLLLEYDALFLGLGADKGKKAGIPGEALENVYQALDFLVHNIYSFLGLPGYEPFDFRNKKLVILGGGDTAMDCNRSALRLEAFSVDCVYRQGMLDMPGARKEIKNAIEEGVHFVCHKQAVELIGDKKVEAIKLVNTVKNASGRLEYQEGSEYILPADTVIIAYGFDANPPEWLEHLSVDLTDKGLVETSEKANFPFQTSNPRIFCGGDMVLGADLVVRAIAQGVSAAESMLRYMQIESRSL
ncbi:FAD-dependent oxidoreductase [Legionella sp. 16cNR16C]|uniref:FAD-dependent oxidoreductase n=1 Tax=Legionella sp. 16cNR16C TaxID=2905656 RepID=UPI001E3224C3|nr:FAD-dependent oxidoreductase [Legionella sp. 16cNR16C]MCE3045756.1 FAD-dependent oxidoreductase [Legionella sp. 16cNR16C]